MSDLKSASEQMGVILKRWQERLIDVSKSNPLLGLNRSRAAKLEITSESLDVIIKILLNESESIKLPFVQRIAKKSIIPVDDFSIDTEVEKEEYLLREGDIDFIYQNLGDLNRKIRKIFDSSRLTLNERGVNTLYVALGCLSWSDPLMGDSESPLIMIPCSLEYKGAGKAMELVMADEDIILNPAIRYYLKERHEIELPDIQIEEFSFDKIDSFLESITKLIEVQGWKITKRAWFGIFSFESLAIYQDLKLLDAEARENSLIQAIAQIGDEAIENLRLDDRLDEMETPQQIPIPVVQADSSQLRAITLASQGANLVIHGPPGTGKSQTITAIIANALGQNKKVLFVSSKMAALNVVHARLQSIGLGQYCLEAHGVKSGKKKVIDELKRSFETIDDIKIPKNFQEDLNKMLESRKALNDHVKILHDSNNRLTMSLFNAYGVFESLSNTPLIKAPLPWTDILDVSAQDLEGVENILREVQDNASLLLKKDEHPLRGMKSGGVDLPTQERFEVYLVKIVSFCEKIKSKTVNFSQLFTKLDLTIEGFFSSQNQFLDFSKVNQLPLEWNKKSVEELNEKLKEVLECKNTFQAKEVCSNRFKTFSSGSPKDVLEFANKFLDKYQNWTSRISLKYLDDKKECKLVLDKVDKISISLLNELKNCAQDFLVNEDKFSNESLKVFLRDMSTAEDVIIELETIQKEYETAITLKRWVETTNVSLSDNPSFTKEASNNFSALFDILSSSKEEIIEAQRELAIYWPSGFLAKTIIDAESFLSLEVSAKEVLKGLNQIEVHNWQTISRILEKCENSAVLSFIEKLSPEELTNATEIFKKRFYHLWVNAMLFAHPILNEFLGSTQTDLINKYRILDEKVMRLNLLNTIAAPARAASELKNAQRGIGDKNGIGILRKEMEKKKGLKPLRKLFNDIPGILQVLKPCFLMSPLSVSTFLKPGAFNFDLVIFDEASQLPTPEAIPAILRAKQVVVAGDSNQLPPSSFFRTDISGGSNDWEEGQIEELESLLDDCKASVPFFQETDLKWHYRSRDERLISFSNHYYYENRLITFPSPTTDTKKSGVILEYVPDGVWDRGGSRINRKEARHVAKLIIHQFKTEPEKTLGVVAFNTSQKEAIEDALDEELQSCRELVPLMDPERAEAFFVKSLENVQGDERDVIIISVGYGKAQDGKMSLNFGPLNNEGGWRRLNVLVTRAKWKTVLVTSIRASDMIGINPENRGPMGLKNYIQYAETGFLNEAKEAPRVLGEETNDFEDSVRRELENRGFRVDAQVGVGSFKIDLAVRDPKNTTGYALGIECDGASYHSSRSARDRDILRQEILQGMGWKLYRVWSTEWFKNREAAVALLVESVTRATNGQVNLDDKKNEKQDLDPDELDNVHFTATQSPDRGIPYKKSVVRCTKEIIMNSNKIYRFADVIVQIVRDEAPIHNDLILQRIREVTDVGRVGSNIQSNFDAAIKLAIRNKEIDKLKDDKDFLFKTGENYSDFRTPANGVERRLDQISKIEMSNAIKFLIKDQFGLAYDNAVQSVKHLFGVSRANPEESDRVKDIIDEMISTSQIVKHGPLLNLSN